MRKGLFILAMGISLSMSAQEPSAPLPMGEGERLLYENFQNPPQEARPRVWWHWMNGNVTKEGIRKDIEWMHRVGIGGFHHFDAGMATLQVVEKRLDYMSPEWKEAFKYAVALADSLGMEVATASAPGWSNTGGPWVKPEQAMKKLVWREMRVSVKGKPSETKRISLVLPKPYTTTGFFQNVPSVTNATTFMEVKDVGEWYRDLYVVAVRCDKADKTMQEMKATVASSGGSFTVEQLSDGDLATAGLLPQADDAWIEYRFPKPQTIHALSIVDGYVRSEWGAEAAPVKKHLEVSDDGRTYRRVCDIPDGGAAQQTIEIEPTTAKRFRVVFDKRVTTEFWADPADTTEPAAAPIPVAEFVLHTVPRINHAEEKAGFATPSDLKQYPTAPLYPPKGGTNISLPFGEVGGADTLTWDAPAGDWKIFRFGYSLTGKQNHPASPEATGLEVTKLDKEAFADYLTHYLDTYRDASGGLMGERGLHYLLIDSYEAGWETWCPQMPQEFERRRGYSLLPWLPVLTGEIIGTAEESEQFLLDWRTTIGELIAENMYGTAAEIAHQRGMETYFEAHENGRLYLPDGMSVKSKADIPMAALWVLNRDGISGSTLAMAESDVKESSSVAHVYGKRLVAGESLTVSGLGNSAYNYYPGNLKPYADLMMANGLNRFVIHESSHQPVDDKKPGLGLGIFGQWFNRHETWAEQAGAWMDYLARSCYMLQQGRFVADIAYYYGEDDNVTSLFGHQHPDIPDGYAFDYINSEALINLLSFDGTYLTTPSGMKYRLLLLDKNCEHLSVKAQQKIEELRKAGAMVVAPLNPPNSPLNSPKGGTSEPHAIISGGCEETVLPDFSATDMSDLRYVHRTAGDTEIYWVNNRRNEPRSIDATFRVSGLRPMLWIPETGERREVSYEIQEDRTTVHLELVANDAVFVVFSGKADEKKVTLPEKKEILFRHIDTPWTVQFDPQWGGPKETQFDKLISYTESTDEGIKYYSGTAVYKNSVLISKPELRQGRFKLDLGQVGCIAEVTVNGKQLGTLWKAPYTIDITEALQAGTNDIEIRVTNLWANRVIGDLQPDCKHSYTYPACNIFFRANAPLLPSGLIGPVDIRLVQDNPLPYTSIRPGQIWLDTDGEPIQAHGSQILEEDGTYYWYGENKEFTTRGSHVWTYGIRCYRSTDFYNWEDCGLIIQPDTTDYLSPLHYTQSLDRPHIVRCPKTGKYVCWIKSMDEDGYFVILQADSILGPYRYVRSLKPEGYGVGDFDLYADPATGKGYVWFERPHWELICAELTDDYTDVTPIYSSHFAGLRPPYTREAPTHFVAPLNSPKGETSEVKSSPFEGVEGAVHFLFTSGTTGYYPNLSMIASFSDPHGTYRDLGNPHPSDKYNHSFCSQITDVVKIPGRNLYVAVADRWMPQIADTTEPAEEAKRMVPKYADHQPFPQDFTAPQPKDKRNEVRTTWDVTYNATYVFLPITFKNGIPQIEWRDEWRLEDYE